MADSLLLLTIFPVNADIYISFVIVSNIAITTLKFVNKDGVKIQGNGFLEFKQITQPFFGLKNNFHIAFLVMSLLTDLY